MYISAPQEEVQYVAVADAGSTGTRFFLYKFQDALPGGSPNIEKIVKLKLLDPVTHGDVALSSLAGKSEAEVWEAVRPVLKELVEAIPTTSGSIPLFVFATVSPVCTH